MGTEDPGVEQTTLLGGQEWRTFHPAGQLTQTDQQRQDRSKIDG